jgi:hypothetical protein
MSGSGFAALWGMKLSKMHWENEREKVFSDAQTGEAWTAPDLKQQQRISRLLKIIEQLSWRTYLRHQRRIAR